MSISIVNGTTAGKPPEQGTLGVCPGFQQESSLQNHQDRICGQKEQGSDKDFLSLKYKSEGPSGVKLGKIHHSKEINC